MKLNKKPLVSIIILNYNGRRFLEDCLLSVLATEYPRFEVVLVDNASTDNSLNLAEELSANDARLKVVKSKKNMGFGAGNNLGLACAKGDYIVFLNNDTWVYPDWLTYLVETMEQDRTIGLAQSMILSMDSEKVQTAGWLVSDYCVFLYSIGSAHVFRGDEFPDVFEVSYASGAAMITRRELLKQVGEFDPKYFWFYDDNYLSYKIWLIGKRVVTISRSRVRHFGGGTSGEGTLFQKRCVAICLLSLNFDIYMNKLHLVKAMLAFAYNTTTESLKEIVEKRKNSRFRANSLAFAWTLCNLKHVWKSRLRYWSIAKVDENTLLYSMLKIHIPFKIYFVPSPAKLLWSYLRSETTAFVVHLTNRAKGDRICCPPKMEKGMIRVHARNK